ncbi:MAG: type II secretion system protein M [Betaproteobacteria bacterium]|nr:type II secretion system protein M [Betaproteobacteria bacterium]
MTALSKLSSQLSTAIAPLQQRWHGLELRQRRMIAIGGTVVAILLLIAYVWLPLARERQRLITALPQMSAQLAQMKLQAQEISQLNAAGTAVPPARAAADPAQLQALFGEGTKVSLDANRAFRIVVPKIAYAAWWDRVNEAQSRFPLRIATLSVQALPSGNREVSVDMKLADPSRPAAPAGATAK